MIRFIRALSGTDTRTWLGEPGYEGLYTVHFKGVKNPLDPDPLWDHRYGGNTEIQEQKSGSHKRRLRMALEAHRYTGFRQSDFAFPLEDLQVFTDVVIWIAQSVWRPAALQRGNRLYIMAEKLKYRHQHDFDGEFFQGRTPRYVVMPHHSLARDEVVCQFGLSVYLPSEEDKQIANISLFRDGQTPLSPPDWIFFKEGKRIQRPAALYETQGYLTVAGHFLQAPICSPVWFEQNKGLIAVDMLSQPEQAFGDEVHVSGGEVQRVGNEIHCEFRAAGDSSQHLTLAIQPFRELSGLPAVTEQESAISGGTLILGEESSPLSGLTKVSTRAQAKEEPAFRYYLMVTGIVLPRLNALNIAGLTHWVLHLNAQGLPAASDEKVWYSVQGDLDGRLRYRHEAGGKPSGWQSLTHTTPLKFAEGESVTLEMPVLEDKQYGILPLTQAIVYSVTGKANLVGRDRSHQPNKDNTALRLLGRNDSLQWVHPPSRPLTFGHIGLSGQHIEVHVKGQDLQVKQLSRSAPTWLLRKNGKLRDVLYPGSEAEAIVKPEEGLLLGNYRLQYHEEYTGNRAK